MTDYANLNESQRLAVTHGEGPLLLLAGPGSGKTFTITQRILCLLERGIPPEKILVVTFTKDAAVSMQQRFRKVSFTDAAVNFGTFHSVFYHMLKSSGRIRTESILKDSQKKNILLPILKKYDKEIAQEDVTVLLKAISFYKNTLALEDAAKKAPEEWQEHFPDLLKRYEAARQRLGAVDFDDMVCECQRMLSGDQKIRQYWQGRFEHILMDEFQDINPIQYETVKLLARPPYNLFAVGDDDQAIYGFRGAQPDCLKRFAEEFNAKQMLLNINYRSCKEIVDASCKVISNNNNRFEKKLQAFSEAKGVNGEAVILKSFPDKENQYEYLVRRIGCWIENQEECAVLFRTNVLMQKTAARLRRAGIAYVMKEKAQSIYEHFIVKDIMSYLMLAQGEWSRERFLNVCNRPSRFISREALGSGESFSEVKRYYANTPRTLEALELFQKQLNYIGTVSLRLAVTYICKAAGYEDFLRKQCAGDPQQWREWQEMLEWVKADAQRFENVRDWMAFQENYKESIGQREERTAHDRKKAVHLMTVHGSKGLEFPHVLIPDCNEGVFPHGRMIDDRTCEEERRIFYVAMTRAAKSLELLYLHDKDTSSRLPSRFLNPLLH